MNAKDLHDIFVGLIGGIIVVALDRLIIFLTKKFKYFRFKQVFGSNVDDFNIVYGKMILKPEYQAKDKFTYLKPNTRRKFYMSAPVSFAETKSAKYISESFSKWANKSPKLISDDEIRDKTDISYCSVGGLNNFKTSEILDSSQNRFYIFSTNSTVTIVNKMDLNKSFAVDGVYDYAIIIKIKNRLFPSRVQICVAGLGEWGTSGGAWFLSNKWKEIRKKVGSKEFGAVIKVKGGSDESAEIIDFIN
jgi:hypothetical protein